MVQSDKVATIHFTVKDENGVVQDSTQGQHPYSFVGSSGNMFPRIEEEISGMECGEKVSLELKPEDAYGEFNEDWLKKTSRSDFPEGVELKEGMTFLTKQQDQDVPVTVKKIDGDDVTIDFNHPLAGKTVSFELELVEIRDATEEEKAHGHVHGPGCSH